MLLGEQGGSSQLVTTIGGLLAHPPGLLLDLRGLLLETSDFGPTGFQPAFPFGVPQAGLGGPGRPLGSVPRTARRKLP